MYEYTHGTPVPSGLEYDHLCRKLGCFDPDYGEAVEPIVNKRRAMKGGPNHCPQGHEYTPDNTYINPNGTGRECKVCKRRRSRDAKRRKRANQIKE